MPIASGHSRLKRSLVLRDALAADLVLDLDRAARRASQDEDDVGAADAAAQGRYLDALTVAAKPEVHDRLCSLDATVLDVCARAGFTPRYFQYLALILACHYLERYFDAPDRLLEYLTRFQASWRPEKGGETVAAFAAADLQSLAFWMATGSGKTHLLHALLGLLEGRGWDRMLLITPSETLSSQHAAELRKHTTYEVFVYPEDGDASALARLPRSAVIVLDINKLKETKVGEGVTLPVTAFADGRNLVFVDEGHKGQGSEASVWKEIQRTLAGVGSDQHRYHGLLIEFSATFGQVADAEHAFDFYAKSIVFDYPYDRFHRELYGKDPRVINLRPTSGLPDPAHNEVLAAALATYWHQLQTFRAPGTRSELAELGLSVKRPLWVLLGLSVIGGKATEADKAQTSDVIRTLLFLRQVLGDEGEQSLGQWIDQFRAAGPHLPEEVKRAVGCRSSGEAARAIRHEVFGMLPGGIFVLRTFKGNEKELGIGLAYGDRVSYFGVVNVGDARGLGRALEENGLETAEDAFTPSLFGALDEGHSAVNLLIGSRRFSEGWNTFRASLLTLLNLGRGEGPLIIQMFGRMVRFAGREGDMKRLSAPSERLKPLQTAYVYGLRSDYMERFLASLTENGVSAESIFCRTMALAPERLGRLARMRAAEPDRSSFRLEAVAGSGWYEKATTSLSLHTAVHTTRLQDGGTAITGDVIGEDLRGRFVKLVPRLDMDRISGRILEYRRRQGAWNLRFDRVGLIEALRMGRYRLEGPRGLVEPRSRRDLARLENIAVILLQRLIRKAYRNAEDRQVQYEFEFMEPGGGDLVGEIELRRGNR